VAQFVKSLNTSRDLRQQLRKAFFCSRHGFFLIEDGLSIAIECRYDLRSRTVNCIDDPLVDEDNLYVIPHRK
jgi:hypothetical protein